MSSADMMVKTKGWQDANATIYLDNNGNLLKV